MKFRLQTDDILEQSITHELGRLMIAYQVLEDSIRTNFPQVIGLSDTYGVTEALTGGWTSGRKAEEAIRIVRAISNHFQLPPAQPRVIFLWDFDAYDPERNAVAAREAASTVLFLWQRAKAQLDYRNRLFHGRLKVSQEGVTLETKGAPMPFTEEEFQTETSAVVETAVFLYYVTSVFVDAVEWLSKRKTIERTTEDGSARADSRA